MFVLLAVLVPILCLAILIGAERLERGVERAMPGVADDGVDLESDVAA